MRLALTLFLAAIVPAGGNHVASAQDTAQDAGRQAPAPLPPDIMIDKYLVQGHNCASSNDHSCIVQAAIDIQKLLEIGDLSLSRDFYYRFGELLFLAKSYENAIDSLQKYLRMNGKDGSFYQEALKLLTSAESRHKKIEDLEIEISNIQESSGAENIDGLLIAAIKSNSDADIISGIIERGAGVNHKNEHERTYRVRIPLESCS